VFFAINNTDFSQETADGKGTTHGTINALSQKAGVPGGPVATPLRLGDTQSLSVIPYHVHMLHCDKSKPKHAKRTDHFVTRKEISGSYKLLQLGWIVDTALSRMEEGEA
jgi:hypothetical protein